MATHDRIVEETIRKFDMASIKADAVVFVIGKRGGGKSTLIRDILYHNRHKFNIGIGMCPTEKSTGDMARFLPGCCLYNEFSESGINRIMAHQKKIGKGNKRNVCVIMDDCAFDKKVFNKQCLREVFMNGRHERLFIINAVQYMMDIPTSARCNIDYVFATRDNIIDQKVKLWKFFFGMFADFESFSATLDQCTRGFDVIVMDSTSRTGKLTDSVFWYAADENLPEFRLGDDVYWDMDRKYRTEEVVDDRAHDAPQKVRRVIKKSEE